MLVLAALFSAAAYIALAYARGAVGFPLDDAWIHQVYARNLARYGEFAFTAGTPSAGSTSPLWTLLLSAGYLLNLDYRLWTFFSGALLLGASAVVASSLAKRLLPASANVGPAEFVVPLLVLFEWHLAWSAVSGMEIPLFVFLSLLLFERFYSGERPWVVGIVGGLLTLTRPEGLVPAALVGLGLFARTAQVPGPQQQEPTVPVQLAGPIRACLSFAAGWAAPVIPFAVFNLAVSGTLLPNTFYAKSAEYVKAFASAPFLARWAQLFLVPWVGAQILLLPGLLYLTARQVSSRQWLTLVPFAWTVILPALYALRLPVAYQHGRYEMPVIPFIVLYGVLGTAMLLSRLRNRIVRATWTLSTGALLVLFWLIGADAYSQDVAIIDCEMVQTARWVADHAPAQGIVAAHDIGALGFFHERPVIDLAGLVTPEVIPFIRDQARLREYLVTRQASLIVLFPDWYPTLTSDATFVPVYQRDCPLARQAGGTDMTVYRIRDE